jgi:hypothetical protein
LEDNPEADEEDDDSEATEAMENNSNLDPPPLVDLEEEIDSSDHDNEEEINAPVRVHYRVHGNVVDDTFWLTLTKNTMKKMMIACHHWHRVIRHPLFRP